MPKEKPTMSKMESKEKESKRTLAKSRMEANSRENCCFLLLLLFNLQEPGAKNL